MKLFTILFSFLAILSLGFAIYYYFERNNKCTKNTQKKSLIMIVSLILLAFSSYLLAVSLDITNDLIINTNLITKDYTKVGPFGDLIGGIMNPIVAFIGIIAASLAFYAQYVANKQVQNEFKIQQFESQFYEMLRLHKENLNEMRVAGYEVIIETSKERDTNGSIISLTETFTNAVRMTEGREVFVTMNKELIACFEFLEYFNNLWDTNINQTHLLDLSYKFFFFGTKSDIVSSNNISIALINNFKYELNNISRFHKNSSGVRNTFTGLNSCQINLHINYEPFIGHENRLGHYYRHLYSTVKYVVNKEKEGLIDYKQSREYLKILRSQMSNDEQLMLYYNYIIGFGKDWENEGYLTKYRMLHNLPINEVKYAENPRTHFQEFIKSIKPGEGELFEWGDYEN